MEITWTLLVFGALLQSSQTTAVDSTTQSPDTIASTTSEKTPTQSTTTVPIPQTTTVNTPHPIPPKQLPLPATTVDTLAQTTPAVPTPQTTPTNTQTQLNPTVPAPETPPAQSTSADPSPQTTPANKPAQFTSADPPSQTTPAKTPAQSTPKDLPPQTTPAKSTPAIPDPQHPSTNTPAQSTPAVSSPQSNDDEQHRQTTTSNNSNAKLIPTTAPDSVSTISSNQQTTATQTSTFPTTSHPLQNNGNVVTPSKAKETTPNNFNYDFDLNNISKEDVLFETCKTLAQRMNGNCSVTVSIQGKQLSATAGVDADRDIPEHPNKPPAKKEQEDVIKEKIPDTLIAILASCGALVLILCFFAAYCTYHRRSYRKNQQHLTEELQTVENGYHDNPTLEVMEVQPEMQEKKVALNGEFNDSWIVPIDNLLKEDMADEEDTHL